MLIALAPGLRADDQPPAPVTDPAVAQQEYHAIVAKPEFHETNESFGDLRWTDWLSQWLTHLVSRFQDFKYANEMSGFARLLVYLLAALAIAGAIYVLVRLSRRKRDGAADEVEELPPGKTFLSPLQYEKRLSLALENHDWHAAWLAASRPIAAGRIANIWRSCAPRRCRPPRCRLSRGWSMTTTASSTGCARSTRRAGRAFANGSTRSR
jgi:hypothetical protein